MEKKNDFQVDGGGDAGNVVPEDVRKNNKQQTKKLHEWVAKREIKTITREETEKRREYIRKHGKK